MTLFLCPLLCLVQSPGLVSRYNDGRKGGSSMKCGPNVCAIVVQLYRIVYSVGFITLGLMPFEASRAEWRVEVSFSG